MYTNKNRTKMRHGWIQILPTNRFKVDMKTRLNIFFHIPCSRKFVCELNIGPKFLLKNGMHLRHK